MDTTSRKCKLTVLTESGAAVAWEGEEGREHLATARGHVPSRGTVAVVTAPTVAMTPVYKCQLLFTLTTCGWSHVTSMSLKLLVEMSLLPSMENGLVGRKSSCGGGNANSSLL